MLTVTTRHAIDPVAAKAMDTTALRDNFLVGGLFATGEIRLVYSHYDRMIHCGAGTGSYSFCWAMAGDNVDYRDVEMVAMADLK